MAEYQRIPTNEGHAEAVEENEEANQLSLQNPLSRSTVDEFNRQPPALWKRIALIFTIFFLGWAAIRLGRAGTAKPEVIYATRYSDEFKYRPAASPVITEKLKDGRLRIRGASPAGIGIHEGVDIPFSPAQKRLQEKKAREKAEKEALEKLLEAKRKTKERRKRRKTGKSGDP